ncbi:MAG: thiol-activated cytolysin family protein [Aurantibacter sp.]
MKTQNGFLRKLITATLVVLVMACSKDDNGAGTTDPTPLPTGTVAEVVASGDAFENYPPNTTETETGTESAQNEDYDRKEGGTDVEQRWICTEKEVDITGGTHTFPLYNTNASVIWPGNLLQSKSLDNATPSDIVVKRAGGKITYNLVTGNPQATVEVPVIDQGTVQQAMNDVIAQNGEITPANFTLDVVAINSKEELALEMGLKASSLTTKVSSSFSLNTSSEYSSVLVKLTQAYYTMSYVKPTSLTEVFDPSVTGEDLAKFVQSDNPATFISSVTYGRIFYMLYESTASAQDMEFALKGSYNAVAGKVSGSVNIESLREYNNLSIKVIAYGGDSEGTLNSVGATFGGEDAVDNLQDIVGRLAASSDIAGGLPLSYVVNSLEDPSQVVSTNLATTYTIKNCELKGVLPPVLYDDLLDLFDDGIGALLNISGSNVLVFNKAGDSYAWFNAELPGVYKNGDDPIKFSINDPNGPLGDMDLEDVGAAVDFSLNVAYIFSGDGSKCQIATINQSKIPGNAIPMESVVTYSTNNDDGSKIFLVNKIFGDLGTFKLDNGMGAAVSTAYPTMAYFERNGTDYQRYRSQDPNVGWNSTLYPSNGWFSTTSQITPGLFDKVGAATKFTRGGGSTRYLFVNEEGDEIMDWISVAGPGDTFDGPYVIN